MAVLVASTFSNESVKADTRPKFDPRDIRTGKDIPNENYVDQPYFVVTKDGNELINAKGGGIDFYSEAVFGDAIIELEVMVPKGSNSGVYVMGEYEIQVLDSFGRKKLGGGDMGAIYGAAPPRVNACKKPGEWQKYEIVFHAPKYKDGKKVKNAQVEKVVLNGKMIQEKVELPKPTPGGLTGKEMAKGPIMFQGDHGPVAYRNIKITPLK